MGAHARGIDGSAQLVVSGIGQEHGATLAEEELKAFVKRSLASYKVPREVAFIDALPRNATGKVLRSTLV